jgi:preprotein translocase subunit YajC
VFPGGAKIIYHGMARLGKARLGKAWRGTRARERRLQMKKGDRVKVKGLGKGKVTRVAKDGAWVEVDFGIFAVNTYHVTRRVPADKVKKRIF